MDNQDSIINLKRLKTETEMLLEELKTLNDELDRCTNITDSFCSVSDRISDAFKLYNDILKEVANMRNKNE
ncbi:hypothetical protein TUBRATIS_000990 [Tubulinosema ratisbonensis]|uniref:Uncharacterized protein n=1 Tax=Tubulinosema ratisbonensis TaxID=291195 RepID=A0A437AQ93_9MICR|nr:hypothetical protein TUBRATIS_000990 [Tubulinosema ratisbonensis]